MPPALHHSIMRSVRASIRPEAQGRFPNLLRWLPAPTLAAIALVVGLAVFHRSHSQQPLPPAATVLEAGHEIAQAVPGAVMTPLTEEWRKLNQDLDNTARFLLASLPYPAPGNALEAEF